MGPGDLEEALSGLSLPADENVLRGMADMDNAGVYRLSDELAIVQTVDYFTPVVDDPYTFGQIAVANSLSDVYAMGARPVTALNIVCFPSETLPISVLKQVLRGGAGKMAEAGVALLGGHSIDDVELKYGLAVTGTVNPQRLVTNGGARPGDRLILTKPIGGGILSTALKAGVLSAEATSRLVESMVALNRAASELMLEAGVRGCTDITGFGFAGHASQMAANSGVAFTVRFDALPLFAEAVTLAMQGYLPGGGKRNQEYYGPRVKWAAAFPDHMQAILFDPQTSGGLLISAAPAVAGGLVKHLKGAGVASAAVVGEVVAGPRGTITVR